MSQTNPQEAWSESFPRRKHLPLPTAPPTHSQQQLRDLSSIKEGALSQSGSVLATRTMREARALLPFKPALLSSSIHRTSGTTGKKDSSGWSLHLHCHPPFPRHTSEPDGLHITIHRDPRGYSVMASELQGG